MMKKIIFLPMILLALVAASCSAPVALATPTEEKLQA